MATESTLVTLLATVAANVVAVDSELRQAPVVFGGERVPPQIKGNSYHLYPISDTSRILADEVEHKVMLELAIARPVGLYAQPDEMAAGIWANYEKFVDALADPDEATGSPVTTRLEQDMSGDSTFLVVIFNAEYEFCRPRNV